MRIRFPDADDAREKKQRAQTLRAIDAWWKALASKVGELDALFSGKKKWDLPKFMQTKLGAIDRRLMWEFGPAVSKKNKHRLVITPESELALWHRPRRYTPSGRRRLSRGVVQKSGGDVASGGRDEEGLLCTA